MKFDVEYIEKLAKVLADTSLTEISLEDGEQAITLRKDLPVVASAPVVAAAPVSAPQVQTPAQQPQAPQAEAKKGKAVTSPMVGTFYSAPAPDADAFVKVGQTVKKGDVVCIVEAMKLMNEIETEFGGKVLEICVQDGQPVEFGQVLMYIEE